MTGLNSWDVGSGLSIIFINYFGPGCEDELNSLPGHSRSNHGIAVTGTMDLS